MEKMDMKMRILCTLLIGLSFQSFSQLKYIQDWNEVKNTSKNLKKDILVIMTGSGWCKPCIKMERNLLEKQEFYQFVNEKYVLFKIDLPKFQNHDNPIVKNYFAFNRKYNTNALPILLVLDSSENLKLSIGNDLSNLSKTLIKLNKIN